MQRFYDANNNRLVYLGVASDDSFWDERWSQYQLLSHIKPEKLTIGQKMVTDYTAKYLPAGSTVLEGGCGIGDKVFALKQKGFSPVGIDYAEATVERINDIASDLDVRLGDVRALPFEDNCFDGYWSLGVIEHFYHGYDAILNEMRRVVKPGGYLFVTVPSLSKLRAFKAKLGLFSGFDLSHEPEDFYQFVLDPKSVIKAFAAADCHCIEVANINGLKGLGDELPLLSLPLKVMFKLAHGLTESVTKRFANHMTLFIFKNKKAA